MSKYKYKFDWSILDRDTLACFLWLVSPKIIDNKLPVSSLHRMLYRHIRNYAPIKVSKKTDSKVDPGCMYIGGSYYSDYDQERKQCIEIIFIYHSKDTHIKLTSKGFWRICLTFADTILHEIIHMRQYRRRKFKILPDYASNAEKTEQRLAQRYLGSSDEIDAYGFNIACDLMTKFKNDQTEATNYLSKDQKGKRCASGCWKMYLKAFNYNHSHHIIKILKKKVIRYLPHAQLGKPYRNKDWIDR